MQPPACCGRELHGCRLRVRALEDAGLVDDVLALCLVGALDVATMAGTPMTASPRMLPPGSNDAPG